MMHSFVHGAPGPSHAEAQGRQDRAVALPSSFVAELRPRERAVSVPQARSGLTPPALFGTSAAGGRRSFPSAERGPPPRVPAYSSPRLVREARVQWSFRLLIALDKADPPYAAPLSHAVLRCFSGGGYALAGLSYCG
ncbi:hypothetical protein NDU88_008179 [Pleurodeles waltl]|uniref:Uncharacterized protein n=1 Tax=Pleurodeles waltl TaxID=8319 RepID=A0AAV7VVQ7_PLEWA|nr:hypothetical protein NDU88_008179 [Pleurodeles waltl]